MARLAKVSTVVRCCRCNFNVTLCKTKTIRYVHTAEWDNMEYLGLLIVVNYIEGGGTNHTEVSDLQCS